MSAGFAILLALTNPQQSTHAPWPTHAQLTRKLAHCTAHTVRAYFLLCFVCFCVFVCTIYVVQCVRASRSCTHARNQAITRTVRTSHADDDDEDDYTGSRAAAAAAVRTKCSRSFPTATTADGFTTVLLICCWLATSISDGVHGVLLLLLLAFGGVAQRADVYHLPTIQLYMSHSHSHKQTEKATEREKGRFFTFSAKRVQPHERLSLSLCSCFFFLSLGG